MSDKTKAQILLDIQKAASILADIADRYDANELDGEARKVWGRLSEFTNQTDPKDIILYTSRGGATLLTLADCLAARKALHSII